MPLTVVGKTHIGETTACRFNHQMVTEKKQEEGPVPRSILDF